MQIRKACRYELMPKGEHIRKMKQFCGCARFVFNCALAYQKAQYESDNTVKFSYTRGAVFGFCVVDLFGYQWGNQFGHLGASPPKMST